MTWNWKDYPLSGSWFADVLAASAPGTLHWMLHQSILSALCLSIGIYFLAGSKVGIAITRAME